MPKYYCDYCDIFLTHDSPSVRKSHNDGWKHKACVRQYYSQFEQDWAQSLIDQKVKEFEAKQAAAAAAAAKAGVPLVPMIPGPVGGFPGMPHGMPFFGR